MAILNNSVIPALPTGYNIDNSVRLNDDDSAYFSRTPASAGNRKTWTWSGWVKRGNLGIYLNLFGTATEGEGIRLSNTDGLEVFFNGGLSGYTHTTPVFRDVSAWYHVHVAVDTAQATASDRMKLYVNGSQITDFSSASYPAQNSEFKVNNSGEIHYLAQGHDFSANRYFDGYLSEVYFIDGQALTPSDFGETHATYGHWIPKKYTGTYGTNGFYLDFKNSASLGNDVSGSNNDWTPTNLAATDQMLDTPTNNFATLNPLHIHNTSYVPTYAEGSLKYTPYASNTHLGKGLSTITVNGKAYAEFYIVTNVTTRIVVRQASATGNHEEWAYIYQGQIRNTADVIQETTSTYTNGDIIGVAVDTDGNSLQFYKNGVAVGSSYTITSETDWTIGITANGSPTADTVVANFGQDSSFAGNKTAQNNADDNGYGDFYYSPPTGYLALCSQNLDTIPTPYQAYSSCGTEDEYLETTYTGNGSADGPFIYLGFKAAEICIDGTNYSPSHADFDFNANGIKIRSASTKNTSSTSYTLEAWVDEDFKYSNAGTE